MVDAPGIPATEEQIRAAQLLNDLWNDSKLGADIRAKAKEKFPDVKLPEDAIKPALDKQQAEIDELKAQTKSALDKLAEREKTDAEAKTFTDLESKINGAAREYGLTDAGRSMMLERMKEQGNYDAEAAAAWAASKAPPPETPKPAWATKDMNLFGSKEPNEQFKALHSNPERYLEDQLVEFAQNPDKYTAETFGQA